VCCYVVDFKIARRVIAKDLKNTRFADYARIYDERVAPPPALASDSKDSGMLAPPWVMFQEVGRRNKAWKTGKSADYLAKWTAWYRSIPVAVRAPYSEIFREPIGWSGFYKSVVSA